jgi:hypothetical protein
MLVWIIDLIEEVVPKMTHFEPFQGLQFHDHDQNHVD